MTGRDYQKTLPIAAGADAVFDALTDVFGLAAWWTRVTGSGGAGGELRFFFETPDPCVMHVDEATRPTTVAWTVTACKFLPEWVGTRPVFTIVPAGAGCELAFRHHGLTPALHCIDMCTAGWNHFLPSLRRYVEVGAGMPHGSSEDRTRRASAR